MDSFSSPFLTIGVTLLLGMLVGALIARSMMPSTRKQRELERNVDRLLQQQKDYQHEVVEHFTDTAKLLGNLAESYRDVHNHLASGAGNLCDDQAGSILRRLPDSSIAEVPLAPDPDSVQAPLDYAPKASPFATGVLNEEFGLEKRNEVEAEIPKEEAPAPRQA